MLLDLTELLSLCSEITSQGKSADRSLFTRFSVLYRGEFLSDYPYDDFISEERARIHRICMETLVSIADYYMNSETPELAIEYFERILKEEPFYEAAYYNYIDLLLSLRATHKAKDVSDKMIENIEKELGSPVTEQISQLFRKYGLSY